MKSNSENKSDIVGAFSFRHTFDSLPKNKIREVRQKIREILQVKNDKSVYDRISGRIELTMSQARDIESLFKEYGIKLTFGNKTQI